MKEKINKIMEPARSAMDCIDYNEGIVIGSAFGQLISIIEEQQEKINKFESVESEVCYQCNGKGVGLDWGAMHSWKCDVCDGTGELDSE